MAMAWRLYGLCLCLTAVAGRAAAQDVVELRGLAQGTTYSVKIAAPLEAAQRAALQAGLDRLLAEFDAQVSTYRDDSEVVRFNASRSTDWFPVSSTTARIVHRALEVSVASAGAFDVTVAPLLKLWRFDRRAGPPQLPDDEAIEAARRKVGYRHLEARLDPPAVRKTLPELELNLNAIAPGYSVDLVTDFLRDRGYRDFLVEIGGELRTSGRKPDGSSWRIGIERPSVQGGPRTLQAAVPLDDLAVATSGDYRQFFEVDGRRYSHTIDPGTGRPVTHGLSSVTVFAPDCTTADAYATALMALGPQRGLELAEREGLAVWMLIRGDDGGLTTAASSAFASGIGKTLIDLTAAGRATSSALAEREPSIDPGANSSAVPEPQLAAEAVGAPSPWSTLLFAVGVFAAAIVGLAVGLILRGKALPGSCGGLAGMRDEHGRPMCPSCTTPPEECAEFRKHLTRNEAEAAGGEAEVAQRADAP